MDKHSLFGTFQDYSTQIRNSGILCNHRISYAVLVEKGSLSLKNKLPNNFNWEQVAAKKIHNKGRAMGGFLIGCKKEWFTDKCNLIEMISDNIIKSSIKFGKEWVNIVSIYNSGDLSKVIQNLQEWDLFSDTKLVIGGDFNIRIGLLGTPVDVISSGNRKSKDVKISNEGRKLVELIENKGWTILNGVWDGDKEGEFTYVGGRGSSVIDYVFVKSNCTDGIVKFQVMSRVESDYQPIQLVMECREERIVPDVNRSTVLYKNVISWSDEDVVQFQEKIKQMNEEDMKEESCEKLWEILKVKISGAMVKKKIRIRKPRLGVRRWWDKECSKKKRFVKIAYARWREKYQSKEIYLQERRELRNLCQVKEKEKKELEQAELRSIRNESQVWRFFNKFRKKRTSPLNNISLEAWKDHFRILLDGSEVKKVGQKRCIFEEPEEADLHIGEVAATIKRLKRKKAAGMDGIPSEAWIKGGATLNRLLFMLILKIWKGEDIPDEWKTAIIVPLYKKGDANLTGNYRGISLLITAYKVYTDILRQRLEKEIRVKKLLPETQSGFRAGRSTMDNIYVLNHLVQMAKEKVKTVYALFIDLKAAFDTIDRDKLWEILEKLEISRYIIERLKGLYEETKCRVRSNDEFTEEFWITKGLRQACVLTPILFCLYIADLDKEFSNRNVGRLAIGSLRIWSLTYADDMSLLAYNREAMLDMLDTLKRFLEKRSFILSTERTKMLVFNKSNKKEEKWVWNGKQIEEVVKFVYLGFTF